MGILSWTEDYGDEMFMNFNMSKLHRDEAYLNVSNDYPIYLYSIYKECYKCPFTKEKALETGDLLRISTKYNKLWRVLLKDVPISPINSSDVLCHLDTNFEEFGVYNLVVSNDTCHVETLKEPVNIYFPIVTVLLLYTLIFVFFTSVLHVWAIYTKVKERETTSHDEDLKKCQQKKRLKSLDTFRGISIVVMIFVNYGSGGYAVLEHAVWNGLQLSDLVFPWFMWIMGVCIPISVSSIIKRGVSKGDALLNILRRSCILFSLGLFLGAGQYLDKLRIFGVLQRFGICYFVSAAIFVILPFDKQDKETKKKLLTILAIKYQWVVAIVLLIIHNLLTFLLNIPNCPSGYLGPGGLHDNGKYNGCTGGAAGYIDKIILGNHRYQYPTSVQIYKSEPFDPEGILGCLTSIIQVILGSQAGVIIIICKRHIDRLKNWLIWGLVLGLVGGLLCGFSKEDGVIPINKNLWSLSYVMVTSSLAFFLLSLCYYLIDMKKYWSGNPFLFAGMNAILMYVGHNMTYTNFPIRWIPYSEFGLYTHFITLFENVWATSMWVLIAYYLYNIKYFLTI